MDSLPPIVLTRYSYSGYLQILRQVSIPWTCCNPWQPMKRIKCLFKKNKYPGSRGRNFPYFTMQSSITAKTLEQQSLRLYAKFNPPKQLCWGTSFVTLFRIIEKPRLMIQFLFGQKSFWKKIEMNYRNHLSAHVFVKKKRCENFTWTRL